MGITNTDFYPHQYRPLLTLLDSPITGILIADEVGLGKTIEAGLIWTEYRARYDARRLLVVCPAMLREKWRDELDYRFGVRAEIVNARQLLEELKRPESTARGERAWIVSYNAARPPRRWDRAKEQDTNGSSPAMQLAQLFDSMTEDSSLIDMVIFDEAHYMRNRETGAWRLGDLLRGVTEFQVMLSATPINLRNEDLFSVLHLLDPDHFGSSEDLDRLIETNRPLIRARDLALDLRSSESEFRAALTEARQDPLLANSVQLERILKELPDEARYQEKRYRAELADSLERVSLLSHVLTRTRKRDVQQDRVQRRVYREAVAMSAAERGIYDRVTAEIRAYAAERGVGSGFLLSMPQRQIASCPAALVRAWREHQYDDNVEDVGSFEASLEDFDEAEVRPLRAYLQARVIPEVNLEELERSDSKFQRLISVLTNLFADRGTDKAIVFTTFRATARYLVERLNNEGIAATLVWGDQRRPKHEVIADFRDDAAQRVLVATEVAAEGVDLQFCQTLVNYDLPWNPTRVEQRIGRIDRLGQKSRYISVWNLHFAETVDERIVTRLLDRLQMFQEALGETEAVVGEQVARLEYELLSRPLTPDEENALIDRAALAIETVARRREELEQNAAHMMAHGQRILERISAAQQLSRFVTEQDLFLFVRDYLHRYWPGCNPLTIRTTWG